MVGLCSFYLIAAELVSGKKSKGEVLVFPRSKLHAVLKETSGRPADSEAPPADRITPPEKLSARGERKANDEVAVIERQTSIFHWQDVCYDIKIKGEPRRILDHVDGWVKPGTLTALMVSWVCSLSSWVEAHQTLGPGQGVSGAGKTTLLDVLATRVTMGVITGEMLVDGRPRDVSFARKTGYCQQQDLHLETSTVREALQFSAILRQPSHIPRNEKVRYVEEIIQLLEMDTYADAVVGVPGVGKSGRAGCELYRYGKLTCSFGKGLNVEQRKRLTIAVELVAKPELLLFLDEPTSGLDSQTSWSILDLLDKLRNHGQAILCTIHQPSAILFERFDRLLFLAKGGRTIYFGEVGQQSSILASYFERNGSPKFPATANPAEFMLEVIGAAPGTHTDIDWHKVWLESPEREAVRGELARLKAELPQSSQGDGDKQAHGGGYREFSASFAVQLTEVTKRVWQQYWRTPTYIWSKALLCLGCVSEEPVFPKSLANPAYRLVSPLKCRKRHCSSDSPSSRRKILSVASRTKSSACS
jgi:ATP-binding cassette, subfamily G (WHITE), member 2, PDR